ncbi:hypothetical protein MKJ04_09910 [Pontibacter sp. E15-1]|uniref:hypothetical protein n=1 Tax=Pontibacter sp. E15-1 TaxID=2919918 RepID=UPI001F500E5D|nr:hypothetical protein [Pontibacter sp. E15-1]MCJ8165156.1 hypothetical protein [Pontibacter sp. E15-1]
MQLTILQAFSRLAGLPLTKTTRHEQVQFFHFGSMHYTTPQGLILDIGEITLAVNCPWHLQPAGGETINHSDVYIRKREAGLPSPVWDWKIPGSSLRDQRLLAHVKQIPAPVVERVETKEAEGFVLHFSDQSTLTVSPAPEEPAEMYWELFSNTGDGLKIAAGKDGLST